MLQAVRHDLEWDSRLVEVHVQKVRFKDIGRAGKAELVYHKPSGRYYDPQDAPHEPPLYGLK